MRGLPCPNCTCGLCHRLPVVLLLPPTGTEGREKGGGARRHGLYGRSHAEGHYGIAARPRHTCTSGTLTPSNPKSPTPPTPACPPDPAPGRHHHRLPRQGPGAAGGHQGGAVSGVWSAWGCGQRRRRRRGGARWRVWAGREAAGGVWCRRASGCVCRRTLCSAAGTGTPQPPRQPHNAGSAVASGFHGVPSKHVGDGTPGLGTTLTRRVFHTRPAYRPAVCRTSRTGPQRYKPAALPAPSPRPPFPSPQRQGHAHLQVTLPVVPNYPA